MYTKKNYFSCPIWTVQPLQKKQQIIPEFEHEFKENSDDYIKFFENNGYRFPYLIHYTYIENLPYILKANGLFSRYYLESTNLPMPNPGGNQLSYNLDEHYGQLDYIHSSLCDHLPMFSNKKYVVVILVDINVVRYEDALFSDMNAADSLHSVGPTLDDLNKISIFHTQNYYPYGTCEYKKMQAEVMIKRHIGLENFLNIDELKKIAKIYFNY